MNIAEAQKEMRAAFLGGFAGQMVSGLIWALSALVSLLLSPGYGMATLFFGAMLIFPLTQLTLRLIGRSGATSEENPLNSLARQIAFTVPVNFLLVGAATLYREDWFYPASMIVVGSHYLPFIFLYGMWQFVLLAAGLVGAGALLALYGPATFSLGGWLGALLLIIFAFVGLFVARAEERG